ncbi:kinase-like protein [Daldinia eschscholtzii]|nr:kinase-like protein [Daldinia eschscholtzii]
MNKDCRFEYDWIEGVESLEKYRPGGYHPITIGDTLGGQYCIVDKLGFGGYSTVWLAYNDSSKHYVAIKVGIANSPTIEGRSVRKEAKLLQALSKDLPSPLFVPPILDIFDIQGPNGTHQCYAMIPAQCNLREISSGRLFSLKVSRALSYGISLAISHIHSKGYVHGDVHLRNVLLRLDSSLDQFPITKLYEKYGPPETIPITRRDRKPRKYLTVRFRRGKDCRTPLAMRPPEARFESEAPLSFSADIWSLAVAIWEVLGMKAIFSSEFVTEDDVASQQIDVLGPMPSKWWERWDERAQFFDDNGHPKDGRQVWPPLEEAFEEGIQKYRRKWKVGEFDKEEIAAILDLIRRMLTFLPKERLSIEEVLKSEWMVKWALPDFESFNIHT